MRRSLHARKKPQLATDRSFFMSGRVWFFARQNLKKCNNLKFLLSIGQFNCHVFSPYNVFFCKFVFVMNTAKILFT